jgi:hypothetical protein
MSTTFSIFLGTVMKTLRSERIRKSPKLPSSSEVKVASKESTTISQSSETKWQNNDNEAISSMENQIIQLQDNIIRQFSTVSTNSISATSTAEHIASQIQ